MLTLLGHNQPAVPVGVTVFEGILAMSSLGRQKAFNVVSSKALRHYDTR